MDVKRKAARALTRMTGYEVRRARPRPARAVPLKPQPPVPPEALAEARRTAGERLLEQPVFILSSVRSGSTLVRVMLNSHSMLYSPHELHLRDVKVKLPNKYVVGAMAELGSDERELEHLLWDRLLHRELMRHGKDVLVNKTPNDSLIWRRIVECWPDARFIFLLRHPAAVVDSWNRARTYWTREETTADVLRYVTAVEEARQEHGGLTVRYEDVTEEPERETRRICEFLGVPWEPGMLAYGDASHGDFRPGLGDWSEQIKSGRVQPARPLPSADEVPAPLRDITEAWGYLRQGSAAV